MRHGRQDRDRGRSRIIKSEEIFCLIIPEEATILCQGVANMSLLIRHVKLIDEASRVGLKNVNKIKTVNIFSIPMHP